MKTLLFMLCCVTAAVLAAAPVELAEKKYAAQDGTFAREIKAAELFCSIPFKINETAKPGINLVFEYKVTSTEKTYVAVNMRGSMPRTTYTQTASSANWCTAVMPLDRMFYAGKGNPKVQNGDAFTSMTIYAKNSGDPKAKGTIRLELRNVRFEDANKAAELPAFKLPYTVEKANFAVSLKAGATLNDGVFAFTSKQATNYTNLTFTLNVPYQADILCSFEYRVKTNGAQVDYVGVNLYRNKKGTFHSFGCKTDWTRAVIRFSELQKQMKQGDLISSMSIYAKCGKTPGTPTLEVRNLQFEAAPKK